MSSKRKSPPTKLDGSNGTSETKFSTQDADAEIDLSTQIKSSPHFSDNETSIDHRISPEVSSEVNHHNQLNGGKVKRRSGDIQVNIY